MRFASILSLLALVASTAAATTSVKSTSLSTRCSTIYASTSGPVTRSTTTATKTTTKLVTSTKTPVSTVTPKPTTVTSTANVTSTIVQTKNGPTTFSTVTSTSTVLLTSTSTVTMVNYTSTASQTTVTVTTTSTVSPSAYYIPINPSAAQTRRAVPTGDVFRGGAGGLVRDQPDDFVHVHARAASYPKRVNCRVNVTQTVTSTRLVTATSTSTVTASRATSTATVTNTVNTTSYVTAPPVTSTQTVVVKTTKTTKRTTTKTVNAVSTPPAATSTATSEYFSACGPDNQLDTVLGNAHRSSTSYQILVTYTETSPYDCCRSCFNDYNCQVTAWANTTSGITCTRLGYNSICAANDQPGYVNYESLDGVDSSRIVTLSNSYCGSWRVESP
ncbi:hypothetical protein OC846_006062 [Tilletia horrida]|uniref:Apple domain-containing protein n=1 Tax=Tilletia horrida TaxID=155126 RepID=A0AAN6JPB7_9BASI|nr:hypothetical protein OC846_006062 [Tilletia horrida]KAK0559529.1 hypothetical protein OC861_006612 [Tilletia horrida]